VAGPYFCITEIRTIAIAYLQYMSRWLRYISWVVACLAGLAIVFWLVMTWYIHSHKQELLKTISEQLRENLNGGELTIADMDPAMLQNFPQVSVALKGVTLRDSLWRFHHKDLLKAGSIYVSVHLRPLLSGNVSISRLSISNGSVFLYTDSAGYSNTSMLKSKDSSKKKNEETRIEKFDLDDVKFFIENKPKRKLFQFDIEELAGDIRYDSDNRHINVDIKQQIVSMAFNTVKGSFLRNKEMDASLEMNYNVSEKLLELPEQTIDIGESPIKLKGSFSFAGEIPLFSLHITANQIMLQQAASFLSPSISKQLKRIDLKKPVDIQAELKGRMKYLDTPQVNVYYQIKKNTLVTALGVLQQCSFTGSFTNELVRGGGHGDANSRVSVYGMKADFMDIGFKADTVTVSDLRHPVLYCRFQSAFPLKKLNDITEAKTFRFEGGTANLNLVYKGLLEAGDTLQPYLSGYIKLANAGMTYVPRQLPLTDCSMLMQFNGYDMILKNIRLQSGESVLNMEGIARNFLSFFWRSPDKVVLDWSIKSPLVKLDQFSVFLQKRIGPEQQEPVAKTKASNLANQLNKVLDASSVNMQVGVDKLVYKNFTAADIGANVFLSSAGIDLKNIHLAHAGGTIDAIGGFTVRGSGNSFTVSAQINKVNVQQLFKSFDNFSQDAIVADNLKGFLNAKVDASGQMNGKNKIVANSINAKVGFDLQEGALINFGPFLKVGKFVFRNRNLANVGFTKLENTIDMNGGRITIAPMLIQSTALNLQVQGVYNPPSGTDISIVVPLRNPKKDELEPGMELSEKDWKKGIIVYLRAQDGSDGNVKISWDPKKKGLKAQEALQP
jgi:ribosomal protein L9